MKIFADFHHSGLARGLLLTLQWRLGHTVHFPDPGFMDYVNNTTGVPGTWLTPSVDMFKRMGGVPPSILEPDGTFRQHVSKDEFMSTNWDAVIASRIESGPILKKLLAAHPNGKTIKVIAHSGNEATVYDWSWAKNFLSSDYLSYLRSPTYLNKIHYSQEMGLQFTGTNNAFVPIVPENLKTIGTFINCLSSFTGPWYWDREISGWGGRCPHCDMSVQMPSNGPHSPFGIWNKLKELLPDYKFVDYGIANTGGMLDELDMPKAYRDCAMLWHYKTYDGYGFSLLQGMAMGRVPLVPRRFHRYRTAGRYLINNLTCIETEWDPNEIANVIKYFTADIDRANKYSYACYNAAKALFNWELEAYRVREFLEKLI